MHCNAKTMIKVGLALAGLLAAAYVALPQARELVLASAPVLLALVCPISMVAMMFMMKDSGRQEKTCAKPEEPAAGQVPPKEAPAAARSDA